MLCAIFSFLKFLLMLWNYWKWNIKNKLYIYIYMLTNAVWSMIELLVNPEVQVPDLVREAWISPDFASVVSVSGQRRTDSIVCFVSEVVLEVVVEVPWWNLRSQSFDLIVWNFVQMSHDLLNSWKQKKCSSCYVIPDQATLDLSVNLLSKSFYNL